MPGEDTLPGLQVVLAVSSHGGERDYLADIPFYLGSNPFKRRVHSYNLITSKKSQLQMLSHWVLGPQHMNTGGIQTIHSNSIYRDTNENTHTHYRAMHGKGEQGKTLQWEQAWHSQEAGRKLVCLVSHCPVDL